MRDNILSIKDLTVAYDSKTALSGVSFDVPSHRITAIIGPSGCGKSTLLRCVNRLISDTPGATVNGSIFLDGEDVSTMDAALLRQRVGMVFQTPAPFPFSIYKNMTYAAKYLGSVKDSRALDELVKSKLELVGLYEEVKGDLNKSALKLSGGQQQRLCIARALTVEPELLMLDEPCSALDVKSSQTIEKLLVELKKDYTILMVTHNLAQAKRIADQVVFLYNGNCVEVGATEQVFTSPKQEETKDFLGGLFG